MFHRGIFLNAKHLRGKISNTPNADADLYKAHQCKLLLSGLADLNPVRVYLLPASYCGSTFLVKRGALVSPERG